MKKVLSILCAAVLVLSLAACGTEKKHELTYVGNERMTLLEEYDCIAIYTQYTNGSSESAIPADYLIVKAYQNGVEIPCLVLTGTKTNGYIQCDTSVQSGVTADVVWIFQLDDESTVTIEFPNSEDITIEITEE